MGLVKGIFVKGLEGFKGLLRGLEGLGIFRWDFGGILLGLERFLVINKDFGGG